MHDQCNAQQLKLFETSFILNNLVRLIRGSLVPENKR